MRVLKISFVAVIVSFLAHFAAVAGKLQDLIDSHDQVQLGKFLESPEVDPAEMQECLKNALRGRDLKLFSLLLPFYKMNFDDLMSFIKEAHPEDRFNVAAMISRAMMQRH